MVDKADEAAKLVIKKENFIVKNNSNIDSIYKREKKVSSLQQL